MGREDRVLCFTEQRGMEKNGVRLSDYVKQQYLKGKFPAEGEFVGNVRITAQDTYKRKCLLVEVVDEKGNPLLSFVSRLLMNGEYLLFPSDWKFRIPFKLTTT